MENHTMLSSTIGLHKTALNNTLTFFSTVHRQGENLLKTTLEQNPWLPESSKDACFYWSDIYSKYLENLKIAANRGFIEIEKFSSPSSKLQEHTSSQEKTTVLKTPPRSTNKGQIAGEKTVSPKRTKATKTTSDKKPIAPIISTEKPFAPKITTEKLITHENPEVKKTEEIKAEASTLAPSAPNLPTNKPSNVSQPDKKPDRENKEPTQNPLK